MFYETLTNRLKLIINAIISHTQSTFILGRLITKNIILANELLYSLNKHRKGNKEKMTVKLDMSKAYDRVEWPFIEIIMKTIGFGNI